MKIFDYNIDGACFKGELIDLSKTDSLYKKHDNLVLNFCNNV